MNAIQFLELFGSVSLQVGIVIIATHWLTRVTDDVRQHSRLWTACSLLVASLLLAGLLLPHFRMVRPLQFLGRPVAVEVLQLESRVGSGIFVVWLVGAVSSLVLLVTRSVQTARFLRSCRAVSSETLSWKGLVPPSPGTTPKTADRVPHEVIVLSSHTVGSPFCWQFHRPYILLPEALLAGDPQMIEFVLRHELEHLRTGHPLQVFIERAVEVIFWFHPMIWWASQQAALTREFMCDEAAVCDRSNIVRYLKTLLQVIEQSTQTAQRASGSLGFGRGPSMLSARARRLVRLAQGSISRSNGRRHAGSLVTLACIASLSTFLWIPVSAAVASHADWSPWPTWSAKVLHDFGIQAIDFEVDGYLYQPHELQEENVSSLRLRR